MTDEAEAEQESELAILSAAVHGNGPNGRAVLRAALRALDRFDREHTGVYLHSICTALRAPMLGTLKELIMERQIEGKVIFPPFIQNLIDGGKLEGLREALLRLLAGVGIALTEDERARIQACTDAETLDRWFDKALRAKTAAEVLS